MRADRRRACATREGRQHVNAALADATRSREVPHGSKGEGKRKDG
jgi:hypothetical protein